MGDGDRTVLVGMDGSEGSLQSVRWAFNEAAARRVRLHVLFAWHLPAMAYSVTVAPPSPEELSSEMGSLLDRALADLNPAATPVQLEVVEGYPARLLMEMARRPDIELVVTGSRGRGGVLGLMLGSVSQDLAVACPKPLAIIPAPDDEWDPTGPVVVGVDGSPHGDQALRWAISEAAVHHTSVRAVTAWSVRPVSLAPRYVGWSAPDLADQAANVLEDSVKRVANTEPISTAVSVESTICEGGPASVLLQEARTASMVVVGRRGLGTIRGRLMGSTSHALAHRSQIPTVIVGLEPAPSPDSASPS